MASGVEEACPCDALAPWRIAGWALKLAAGVVVLATGASGAWAQCEPAWSEVSSIPGVDENVFAARVWDPDGAGPEPDLLVVGGMFNGAGSVAASAIAAWDGVSWAPVGGGVHSSSAPYVSVGVIELYKGGLVVGGSFDIAGATPANRIAWWDGAAWSALGSGVAGPNTSVQCVLVQGDGLVAGGTFTSVGGKAALNVARWDGAAWSALGAGLGLSSGQAWVSSLAEYKGQIYAAGNFNKSGSQAFSRNFARFDGNTWKDFGMGSGVNFSGSAFDLMVYEEQLVLAGTINMWQMEPLVEATQFVGWNGTHWTSISTGKLTPPAIPVSLGVHDGRLVAGSVAFLKGPGAGYERVHVLEDGAWIPLGLRGYKSVSAIASYRGRLVAGGEGGGWCSPPNHGVAQFDGNAWSSVGAGFDRDVHVIVATGDGVYIAGDFWQAMDVPAQGLARWDGRKWQAVGAGVGFECGSGLRALAMYQGELIAAGVFDSMGGTAASNIARWDGAMWHPLGAGCDGEVLDLLVVDGELIASGWFQNAGGLPVGGVARWNGSAWSEVGEGQVPPVHALLESASGFLASSDFGIAEWDGEVWQAITPTNFGSVRTMVRLGDDLVAGGESLVVGGQSVGAIARWTDGQWVGLGWPVGATRTLAVREGQLIAGGTNGIASWDGVEWTALAETPMGEIKALAVVGSDIWVGGGFRSIGGTRSAYVAVLGCEACDADCDQSGGLSIDDFVCFQMLYALGEPGADCDGSGALDIDDFICFQTLYAIGC